MGDAFVPTVLAGVLIYVGGQIVQRFWLKPLQDFRVVLVHISHKVKFWENILTTSMGKEELIAQARADMRDLSSNLESKYVTIPLRRLLSRAKVVLPPDDVREAARKLIFLSNNGGGGRGIDRNHNAISELRRRLKLDL